MSERKYRSEDITVAFEMKRCIHAAECGRRLQRVFDVNQRPWVQPENATADEIQATIDHCPSGALKYIRHDGGPQESAPDRNVIIVADSGEYRFHGDVELVNGEGETLTEEYRLTLCRCGASDNKPYCDNSHREIGFAAPGDVTDNRKEMDDVEPSGALKVVVSAGGPLLLRGAFEIQNPSGDQIFRGQKAALCRCGGSADKPFCDGSHAKIGFSD